ncbi:hypothetical protein RM574_30305 [Streptomyces sp. DSM 41982]|uniref:Secreted protein n=1 Tax=Streptomyces evansiae TaxID=3075535 RepID=A0ABD5EEY9_9ACTN|nr:hypothetical protein [Streptomyces sp. DSM 41982]MDT0419772.1 hypothetical protein [Streptomyces sp. DSM 41982]SCD45984.1 hypothetical protein GA0115246_101998 [Streptomyces sp. SolWspMP-sol7th]
MSAVVPGLALGALTASGCVWYVPALVDLRAGADRPVSRRLAALACLSGWGTTGLAAALLLMGAPLAVAGAGMLACVALRLAAWVRARGEAREDAACWAALDARPDVRHAPHRAVGAIIAVGLTLATATGMALTWIHARGVLGAAPVVAAPVALAACTLAGAVVTVRGRAGVGVWLRWTDGGGEGG